VLRDHQPRLYDYAYKMRAKHKVADMLSPERQQPVLHTSARYPARYCGTALVVPIERHPENPNGILVYDLRYDPEHWLGLSAEELHRLLYSARDALGDDEERLPVKTVRVNHCPVLAPLSTLTEAAAARLEIDVAAGMRHLDRIRERADFGQQVCQALVLGERQPVEDPDQALYSGGFFSDADRRRMEWVRRATPEELAGADPGFEDPRLPELLFRYRARNWPESLAPEENRAWKAFCRERIRDPLCGDGPLEAYLERLQVLRADPKLSSSAADVLEELGAYAQTLWANIER
jgi:exodeoxyribonuclease-1